MRFPIGTILRIKSDSRWGIQSKGRLCQIVNSYKFEREREYSVILLPKNRYDKVDEINSKGLFINFDEVSPAFGIPAVLYGETSR
jgi:hypothetical protein